MNLLSCGAMRVAQDEIMSDWKGMSEADRVGVTKRFALCTSSQAPALGHLRETTRKEARRGTISGSQKPRGVADRAFGCVMS